MKFENYLKEFLKHVPSFQALYRSAEAEAMSRYKLKEPILDVGCGDGIFAEVFFGKDREVYGLDIDEISIGRAKKRGVYKKIVKKDAKLLPFTDEYFNSVLSNSVLEHIDGVDSVLAEIHRVLAKGGSLVLTAPNDRREKLFLGYTFFARLGMSTASEKAGKFQNSLMKHINCWSGDRWVHELKKAGFEKVTYEYTSSKKLDLVADLLMPLSFAGYLEKKTLGYHLGWRKYIAPLMFVFLRNIGDSLEGEKGAVVVVRAIK